MMKRHQMEEVIRLAGCLAMVRVRRTVISKDKTSTADERERAQARVTRADQALRDYLAGLLADETGKPAEWFTLKAAPHGEEASLIHIGPHRNMAEAQAAADALPGVTVFVIDDVDARKWYAVFDRAIFKGE
ncbi:hypothetical protein AXY1_2 [Achromobacter phage AXY1]|nr:hypothetical protein AXY1_2 [Achromobacter phage AXY1]